MTRRWRMHKRRERLGTTLRLAAHAGPTWMSIGVLASVPRVRAVIDERIAISTSVSSILPSGRHGDPQTLCRGELLTVGRALVMNAHAKTTMSWRAARGSRPARSGSVAVAPTLPLWLARARRTSRIQPNPMTLLAYFVAAASH